MLALFESYMTFILRIMLIIFGTELLAAVLYFKFSPVYGSKDFQDSFKEFNIGSVVVGISLLICALFG